MGACTSRNKTENVSDTPKDTDDDGIPNRIPTVSLDASQKNSPLVDGTQSNTEDGGVLGDVPTVTVPSNDDQTGDNTNKKSNNPALHYAVLETLPPPTGTYIAADDSVTPYAIVDV